MSSTLTCPKCFAETTFDTGDCQSCGEIIPSYVLEAAQAQATDRPFKQDWEAAQAEVEQVAETIEAPSAPPPAPSQAASGNKTSAQLPATRPNAYDRRREERMTLLLRRDQKQGKIRGTITFTLDARVQLSPHMADLVKKYKMGKEVLYSKDKVNLAGVEHLGAMTQLGKIVAAKALNLTITVNDLVSGKHIECKDLTEMLEAEDRIREACTILKGFLTTASEFGGEEAIEI